MEDEAAIGPRVETGYETPRRSGFTRTKAEALTIIKTIIIIMINNNNNNILIEHSSHSVPIALGTRMC